MTSPAETPPSNQLVPLSRTRRQSLLGSSLRVATTAAAVSRELTIGVTVGALETSRRVVAEARAGAPPADLADQVIRGWAGLARNTLDALERHLLEPEPGPAINAVTELLAASSAAPDSPTATEQTPAGDKTNSVSSDDLRAMGRALLRRSSALDDTDEHPAFREILSAMAPDEARIVCFLAGAGPQPAINVVEHDSMRRTAREVLRNVSMIGAEAGCLRTGLTPVYLDNLARLGLVHLRDYAVADADAYELIEAQPDIDGLEQPAGRFVKHKLVHRGVELTAFGTQLHRACFTDDLLELPPAQD